LCVNAPPPLPTVIASLQSAQVEVQFAPSLDGLAMGALEVVSDAPTNASISIPLAGRGVPFAEQAANIIESFDEVVNAGELLGQGPGTSANGRLAALRNMLVAAATLIDQGLIQQACAKLQDALNRTDGAPQPSDFVAGPAAAELAAQIRALRSNLGCK